ncbi:hypothetical protein GCM10009767_06060 [Kocuria aegyptia]|uniref:Secreted protein n=2 Tax=Kocuria aegyptia TaxID=330943 RepID=A0ABP4WC58_9MICC
MLGMTLLVAFTVATCAEAEPAQSQDDIYQQEQAPADVLPSHIANGAEVQNWDEESSRLLASHDGHQFFLLRSTTEGNCLVSVDQTPPQTWVAACSPSGRIGMSGPAGVRAELDLEGFDEDVPPLEGWSRPVPELQVLVPRSADRP